ncbi:hypothetical protein CS542_01920 [Pedobacter sp. IW39]|nr:hypothetical protein CS542_01920 [Pedobacter sp. IW39]
MTLDNILAEELKSFSGRLQTYRSGTFCKLLMLLIYGLIKVVLKLDVVQNQHVVFSIAIGRFNLNPNLTQNPGY